MLLLSEGSPRLSANNMESYEQLLTTRSRALLGTLVENVIPFGKFFNPLLSYTNGGSLLRGRSLFADPAYTHHNAQTCFGTLPRLLRLTVRLV